MNPSYKELMKNRDSYLKNKGIENMKSKTSDKLAIGIVGGVFIIPFVIEIGWFIGCLIWLCNATRWWIPVLAWAGGTFVVIPVLSLIVWGILAIVIFMSD
jgi:hypothetical protein